MISAAAAPARILRELPQDLDLIHYPVTVPIPRTDLRSVVTLLDVQHHELPQFFSRAERAYRTWAYDGAARHADIVVTISEYAKSAIVGHLGIDPSIVEVSYLGIDHDRFRHDGTDDERLLAGVSLPERFIVYPANLWSHKNHKRLVEAFATTIGMHDLALVLTGEGYGRERALLSHARRLGVQDRVCFLGHLPAAVVPALYRRAVGMVFPSLYEGFGLPPLEAMASGCPVATSMAGALREVCGDAAILFDPEDAEAISDAIERLAGDSTLRASLQAAGKLRAKRFTWTQTAQRHVEIYARVLEQ
jgi:glycosyltransferase involved in cell wall biosynthesis